MSNPLQGEIALVTGASRGIGAAIADELAAMGATVIGTATSEGGAAAIGERLSTHGGHGRVLNVTDGAAVEGLIDGIAKEFGTVSILVNNAGITRDSTFHKMNYQQWTDVVNTNLNACFNVTRPVIESMRTRRWGRIVQISSINGQKGQYGQANYAAAKAGMHGFTISLAQENAKFGITVNTVSPGYVATDMVMAVPAEVRAKIEAQIPLGRLGKPEEIAHAVAFLAGEETAWMTGANLAINGRQYMGW